MPIHLAPLSRRRFLLRSLAATAGLALGPKALAAGKRTDADSWALLADIHLAGDRSHVARGINMAEHFTSVSQELQNLPKRPAGVFILGDCALNSGETKDYATVADVLGPLREARMPIHLALGNHDNRERFWEAFEAERAAKRPLADKQVALLPTPRANWFILDSLEQTLSTPGLIGPEQLDWLAKALDANRNKPALVLVHHNPHLLGGNIGLKDTAALLEVLRPRRQVKAYIFGHTHNWQSAQDESGLHLVNLPPVAYVFEKGKPSGWVHAILSSRSMKLELRCIDARHNQHGQVLDLKWRA